MKPQIPSEGIPKEKDNVICNGCGDIIPYIYYPAIGEHHYHNKACFLQMCERERRLNEKQTSSTA